MPTQSEQRWATGWRASYGSPETAKYICLLHNVQIDSGTHQVFYPINTGIISLGLKRPGRKGEHSPPSSADVKNDGAVPS
jgi:hypothetical protein